MTIHVHAIAEVAPPRVGVHLLWSGPYAWVYSPAGWIVQRRPWHSRPRLDCVTLTAVELAALRTRHELRIRHGHLLERIGDCPTPLPTGAAITPASIGLASDRVLTPVLEPVTIGRAGARAAIVLPPRCEVITLELDAPAAMVRVNVTARTSFAVGLRDGKVVAGGRQLTGAAAHELAAEGIDTVIVYARLLESIGWCVGRPGPAEDGWDQVPPIARVQLPIRPLLPLADAAAELAEARSRLLPGESVDADEFARLAKLLRALIARVRPARPIDLSLLLHANPAIEPEEMSALDPLRAVLPHPTWRRALGFAWFDRDPSLVPGRIYEYRVTAGFPGDLGNAVFGYHTVPAQTALPADHFLGELRVRLPQPGLVDRFDGPGPIGAPVITRHGVRLAPDRDPWWQLPELAGWSAVIDLPQPTRTVIVSVRGERSLTFLGGAGWLPWTTSAAPLPAGDEVTLTFPAPIEQLRLGGRGFWCGLRVPAAASTPDLVAVSRVLPPVALTPTAPPAPPVTASITNLQAPQPVAVTDAPVAAAPPRAELGFEVRWQPALADGVAVWTPDLPPPPSPATLFQIEHLATDVAGAPWTPLVDGDNLITGHRDATPPAIEVGPGVDLMQLYPEVRAPAATGAITLAWADVFDFATDDEPVRRPLPKPGTHHRYRVRAVDAIGRPSATWIETAARQLQKWAPPPVPVGPETAPAAAQPQVGPIGVHARVLVRGAPDLTDGERALLGNHGSAILLRWGWHAEQRRQDPAAAEFRLYLTRRDPSAIAALATAVTDLGNGRYHVALTLDRAVTADVARGLRLDAGYPFEVLGHDDGPTVVARVVARVPLAGGAYPVPRLGPVVLPTPLLPAATRPPHWGPRIEVVPIADRIAYESAPIFDALVLTAAHPRDALWVGVSAADAEPYVGDQLAPPTRAGNESAIVAVRVEARYQGRPTIVEVPALAPVPVIVAPEPAARPMEVRLDLSPLLTGTGLAAGARVRLERVADAEVLRAYRTDGVRIWARPLPPDDPDGAGTEVAIGHDGDRAIVIAALAAGAVRTLDDRFLVFLSASHPQRARLFQPAIATPIELPIATDVLPNVGARWVYRARRADDAGRLSADGITLRGVVRVPATTAIAIPVRVPRAAGDPEARLRFRVDGAAEVTHLIVFMREGGDGAAELVRVPSAPHLAPAERARLRFPDGTFAAGAAIALAAPVDGAREAVVEPALAAGARARIWTCAMTRDGVVSPLAGPFVVTLPPPPLAAPTLSITGSGPNLVLSWIWPAIADASEVTVERSGDGVAFVRVSARLDAGVATTTLIAPPGPSHFRLRARRLDGRVAYSNVVVRP